MSVRPDPAESHVWIRGTMVSRNVLAPSILNRAFLEQTGMPNKRGFVHCDGHILSVAWRGAQQDTILVWCVATSACNRDGGGGEWGAISSLDSCILS